MTAVVCAAFDAAGDDAIAAVRARLRGFGVQVPREPAHRPHFTLAAAEVDPADVAVRAAAVAQRHAAFDLVLDQVGTFARGTILWLGTSGNVALSALQRDVAEALGEFPAAFGEQTDPLRWRPHCTLARRVGRGVVERVRATYEPITVGIDALATIVVGGHGDVALTRLTPRRPDS